MSQLLEIATVFGCLSLLSIGGGTTIIPEMQHLLHQYLGLSHLDFVRAYSIGQIAPGPNMLSVFVMGEMLDGLPGALVAALAFFIPSSIFCFLGGRLWRKIGDSPWRHAIQKGLEPVTLGLMFAGLYVIAKDAFVSLSSVFLALGVLFLLMTTRISPVILVCGAGLIGFLTQWFF